MKNQNKKELNIVTNNPYMPESLKVEYGEKKRHSNSIDRSNLKNKSPNNGPVQVISSVKNDRNEQGN